MAETPLDEPSYERFGVSHGWAWTLCAHRCLQSLLLRAQRRVAGSPTESVPSTLPVFGHRRL